MLLSTIAPLLLGKSKSIDATYIRYVSETGSDSNSGKFPKQPFRNIQKAIEDLQPCPSLNCRILVEEGLYSVNNMGNELFLTPGIILEGGYLKNSNFTIRDPTQKPSILQHDPIPPHCNPTSEEYCIAVKVIQEATKDSVKIDGLKIISSPSKKSIGLMALGGVSIINTEIIAGYALGTNSSQSIGLYSFGNELLIQNSKISGGGIGSQADGISVGLLNENTTGSDSIINFSSTQILGGGCGSSSSSAEAIGIIAKGSSNEIRLQSPSSSNLIINTGDCPITSGYSTIGILVESNFTIDHAKVRAGSGDLVYGIKEDSDSTIHIGINGLVEIQTANSFDRNYGIQFNYPKPKKVHNTKIQLGNLNNMPLAHTYGIEHNSSGELIVEDSNIQMGQTLSLWAISAGIATGSNQTTTRISRNRIQRGTVHNGHFSIGIYHSGEEGWISNNLIYGGSALSSGNVYGIQLDNGINNNQKILHNTITSGSAPANQGIPIYHNSFSYVDGIHIQNNILINETGQNRCMVTEFFPDDGNGRIRGNVFWGCSILYRKNSSPAINYTTICSGGYLGTTSCSSILENLNPKFSQNQHINPQLASPHTAPFDLQFTSATPCSVRRITNVISGIQSDYLRGPGHPQFPVRPTPGSPPTVSVGAFEDPGNCP